MSKTDAEYMRAYRARRKAAQEESAIFAHPLASDLIIRDDRIAELEAEVKHLKAELAKRPVVAPVGGFGRPQPAPKPGRR